MTVNNVSTGVASIFCCFIYLTADKRDIHKDDIEEYHDTFHEKNLHKRRGLESCTRRLILESDSPLLSLSLSLSPSQLREFDALL